MKKLSIIIPAFNEENVIEKTIKSLKEELKNLNIDYEIIVINDGSKDKTQEILKDVNNINLINHPYNKGYGASLKTGIRNAKNELILLFDADGQHPVESIKELLKYADQFDMISGCRTTKGYKGPYIRQPGKKLINIVANYLTGMKIPDLNCGFRIFKKEQISRFLHLMPGGFSFSTTSTLVFIREGLNVKFVPIKINKRIGKSMVKPKDAGRMMLLILRIIMLFSPLKVFLPISFLLFGGAILSVLYDLFLGTPNISDITILFFISSILIFFFGLLADQLAAIRREIKK